MIKLAELLEDDSIQDANEWVEFLQRELDLEVLKNRFGSSNIRTDIDYATDYYNVIDQIANTDVNG